MGLEISQMLQTRQILNSALFSFMSRFAYIESGMDSLSLG